MLSSLLSSLTSLRDFFSRAFFIAAFIPALLFVFINGAIFYVWSWPVHKWMAANLFKSAVVSQMVVFAGFFFFIWINAYLVSSLTPLWTRTLEGSNWWTWLRDQGSMSHVKRFSQLNNRIETAVNNYANIERDRQLWGERVVSAIAGPHPIAGAAMPTPVTSCQVKKLQEKQSKNKIITYDEIRTVREAQINEIGCSGNTAALQHLAGPIELLINYAISRSVNQHLLALNERNMDFPEQADIAPTRFGNIGQTAQTYAVRAYACNLTHFWSILRRVAQKDDATAKSLENTKSQLDFLVAGYWLSLTLAGEWAAIFSWSGDWGAALASALAGSLICWLWWYNAAVEQYRALQDLITSCLTSYRFQVLTELHIGVPTDIEEERDLWRIVDQALSSSDPATLHYESLKITPAPKAAP
jgi:hypothetical protein